MSHQTAVEHGYDPMLIDEPGDRNWTWKSQPGYKPVLLILAALVFTALTLLPPPHGMIDMVKQVNPAGYKLPLGCKTIADSVNKKLHPDAFQAERSGEETAAADAHGKASPLLTDYEVAQMAKITVCILFLAAFLWGTESLPLGRPISWSASCFTCLPFCRLMKFPGRT